MNECVRPCEHETGQRMTDATTNALPACGRSGAGRRARLTVLGVVVGALASLVLVPATLAAEAPSYNMTGIWATGYLSEGNRGEVNGSYDFTSMDMATGVFSGTAEVEGEHFVVEGTEEGSVAHYTLTLEGGSYTAYDTLHLSILPSGYLGGNGTFNESGYSESGAGFWAEQGAVSGGEPGKKVKEEEAKKAKEEEKSKEEAAKKTKEEAEKAKRPSATMITCNYEFATSENTCLASVADAGTGTPITPTGTVTFTTTSGGFSSGATCSLSPESSSPSIASCQLVYETVNSGLPEITATYGGDSRHTGSAGHTQFLGAGSEEGTAETPPGKPGEYPNEIKLGLEVPTNGTTVEGVAQGPNPSPAPLPLSLPPLTGLDATAAADLRLVETDLTKVDDTGAQNATDVKALDTSLDTLNQQVIDAKNTATTPPAQAEAQKLQQDAQQAVEQLTKQIQQSTELTNSKADEYIRDAFVASRHKTAKRKTKTIKPLGHVVVAKAPAGKLTLTLKLNRAAVNRLAGKHDSVSVYVRVDMLLPSALYRGGLPRVSVQRVTLERTPGGKGHRGHRAHPHAG